MTPEEWKQIDELFDRLVDLPAEQQAIELREVCQGDKQLFDYLSAMLEADPAPPAILDASLDELSNLVVAPDPEQDVLVDGYRLIRQVGEGGMGIVYEARRDDGHFNKRVALKRIKRGMDTDDIVRRFRYERQILASLEHPNIARLIDGGVSDDRPYFVMEYVEGDSIMDYADARQLSVDDRLQLFGSVCGAVQYAHQNLVVHRDLKPSNILVNESGDVKLLDFGIAKLLHEDRDDLDPYSVVKTKTGRRVLTPAYASPEQLLGSPVTTSSDVYSLGVVLYELLTGMRPFENRDTVGSGGEVMVKPSTAISKSADSTEEISTSRSTTIDQLQRRLRGDIDTIVLKALQAEPERRYQSADQFLEDIKRHLAGLPVTARPDTFGYRTRKFLTRHRWGVSMAAIIGLLLIGFAVAMAYQQAQTAIERDTAEEVATFLESLFDASDPFAEERLDTLRVNTLLQRGVRQVEEGLVDEPLIQARMLHIIGRVNGRLGLNEEALPLLEQALSIRREFSGDNHSDVAETLVDLGDVHYAMGAYDAALEHFSGALEIRQEVYRSENPLVAEALSKRGLALHTIGEHNEAGIAFREALRIQQATLGEVHPEVAITLSTMASLLDDQGDYAAAESLHTTSLSMRRVLYGTQHPNVAMGLRNLGLFYRNRYEYDNAEPLLEEAIAINRAILGETHPHLITDLNTLASVLRQKRDYDRADTLFAEVLALRREYLGPDHPDVSITLDSYARVLKEKGEYLRAEELQAEAIEIARKTYGDEHLSIAITTGGLASILNASGDYGRALPAYQKSLALYESLLGADHPNVAVLRSNTAGCLTKLGRYTEAEPLLIKSYGILEPAFGLDHRLTQSTILYLVSLYEAWPRAELHAKYSAMVKG